MERNAAAPFAKPATVSVNPITRKVLGTSPLHSAQDVADMVQKARRAQKEWAALPLKKRVLYFYNVEHYLVKNADRLAAIIAESTGKTRTDAISTEVLPSVMAVRYYCKKAPKFLKDRKPLMGAPFLINKRATIRRAPYGVVGIITPWNYPFWLPFPEVLTGLIAGNAVIVKTASNTQMVGLALKEAFESAELPDGLFNYVNLPGREAGTAFLNAGVDKLFFTGSTAVGKTLMKMAAKTLTPLSLELGGNDPMIVCADANLERAAAGAVWTAFSNAGQSCGAIERVYVQREIYQPFLDLVKQKTEALRIGYDQDFNVDVGGMATEQQMKTVRRQLKDALKRGARVWAQSPLPDNPEWHNLLPATVLVDVNHDMLVMKEETFGPLMGVMPFDTIEEALRLANDTNYGLSASVWSRDYKKADQIARQIQAGAVLINDHLMSHVMPEAPWGGFKESGFGRTHGREAFEEMTQPQAIVHDWLGDQYTNLWYYPYSRKVYQAMRGAVYAQSGENFWQRLSGLWAVARMLPKMFHPKL